MKPTLKRSRDTGCFVLFTDYSTGIQLSGHCIGECSDDFIPHNETDFWEDIKADISITYQYKTGELGINIGDCYHTFKYRGVEYDVPEWCSYIATDLDGTVISYSDEVEALTKHARWCFVVSSDTAKYLTLGNIGLCRGWADSLVEVSHGE